MYVIESTTHGVFVGFDWSSSGNSYGPRFRWSISCSEGDVFSSLEEARRKFTEIKTFKHYAWKRPSWIDDIYILDLNTYAQFGEGG